MVAPLYRLTLTNAPPGLYLTEDGMLVFKTQYGKSYPSGSAPREDHDPKRHCACGARVTSEPDIYIVSSGEMFHGSVDASVVAVTDTCFDAAREAFEVT